MSLSNEKINIANESTKGGALGDVLLVEDRASNNSLLKKTLIGFGYNIGHYTATDIDIIGRINFSQPDILILATDLPSPVMLETLAEVNKLFPLPIIIFAENDSPNMIKSAIKSGVSAYVVSEIIPQRLSSIISVARERFKAEQSLRKELKRTKDQLESRKYIDKAKGIIMEQKQLTEHQAYELIRKTAMNQGSALAEVAKNIIDIHALLMAD